MKIKKMNSQRGGMLLEAITVLGLIAVSAPSIYKKNIERTEEIRDMSKASQLRILKDAASSYIEKQYEQIVRDSADGDNIVEISPLKLSDHLPSGFNIPSGVKIYVNTRKEANTGANASDSRPLSLVSALIVDNEDINETRAGKVVRMIGAEGGYLGDDNVIRGNKGIWEMNKIAGMSDNRVVVSSTYSKNMSSSDYIYRNKVEGYPEANMMFTNVDMNGNSIERIGRLAFRYNNGDKWADVEIGGSKEGSTGCKSGFNSSTGECNITGGDNRDNGLSVMFHGERGEIIGKSRSEAKNGVVYEWEDKDDLTNVTHLDNRNTFELAAGGPQHEAGQDGGYLRLKSGNDIGCARIESNYNMPTRGTVAGLSGGGAFVVCTNDVKESASSNYGAPTATLAGDDTKESGYMIVTNPLNNRKATMYGDYNTSFYNLEKSDYVGGALEGINNANKVAVVLGAEVSSGKDGADKGEKHKESSIMNLNDVNGSLKTQVRADKDGGYIHVYDNNETKPTITLAGSKDDAEDRSHSVIARRDNKGSVKLQADYSGSVSSESGALVVRNESNNMEVAVVSNTNYDAGYAVLKDEGRDKFKAMSDDGGAMYFGNEANTATLNASNVNSNKTVSVEAIHKNVTGGHMDIKTSGGAGKLEIASNNNDVDSDTGAAIFGTNSSSSNTVKLHANTRGITGNVNGGGLILTNDVSASDKRRLELVTSSDQEGSGNGGTLAMYREGNKRNILASAKGPNSSGWMSISKDKLRGVDVYGNYNGGAALLLTPNKEVSQNSDIAKNASTVEFFGNGQNLSDSGFVSPTVNVRGENRNSSVNVYGDITESNSNMKNASNKAGGLVVRNSGGTETAYFVGDNNKGAGGMARIGSSGSKVDIYANKDGYGSGMTVGSTVRIESSESGGNSLIDVVNAQASARIRAGQDINVKEAKSLVVNANSYNGVGAGSGNIRQFILAAIQEDMPAFATAEKNIGHSQCIKEEKNCKEWKKDASGNLYWTGNYVGADKNEKWGRNKDVYTGRMHDYSLYSAGVGPDGKKHHTESARHVGFYNLSKEPSDYDKNYGLKNSFDSFWSDLFNGNLGDKGKHDVKDRWHDNSGDGFLGIGNMNDRGQWSKNTHAIEEGMDFPDQIPPSWNSGDYNY